MIRGWCPSVFEPMQSGDGLLVRIKPRLATITATQARTIANASLRFGNGIVSLTNRGNLQLRGLRQGELDALAEIMIGAELVDPDPTFERVRNIVVSPLVGDDPGVAADTADVARDVETALRNWPDRESLPPKFAIAVDGGGVLPLAGVRAHFTIRSVASSPDLFRGPTSLPPPLRSIIAHREAWVVGTSPTMTGGDERAVGPRRYPGTDRFAFGAAALFGTLDANTLANLADVSEAHADGTLRISPWRTILFANCHSETIAAALPDLVTDPADPRLRVIACPGAPACAQATVPARDDAAHILAATHVHVSGCAKGCAHPAASPVTLVGRDGRYDLVRDGRASDPPLRTGLTIAEVLAEIAA